MLNKKILIFFFVLILLNNVFAYQEDLGTFKSGEDVRLLQTCSFCSYITLDTIKLPNSTMLTINKNMTQSGITFYYDFNQTNLNGGYIYNTYYENYSSPISFKITTNGNAEPEGIVVVIYTIIFIILFGLAIISFLNALIHLFSLDTDLIDAAYMIVSYLGMWMFYYFSQQYLGNSFINEMLGIAINIGWITHIFFPLISFAVSFILTNLKFKQKQKVTY